MTRRNGNGCISCSMHCLACSMNCFASSLHCFACWLTDRCRFGRCCEIFHRENGCLGQACSDWLMWWRWLARDKEYIGIRVTTSIALPKHVHSWFWPTVQLHSDVSYYDQACRVATGVTTSFFIGFDVSVHTTIWKVGRYHVQNNRNDTGTYTWPAMYWKQEKSKSWTQPSIMIQLFLDPACSTRLRQTVCMDLYMHNPSSL